eukprot:GHUV01033280.1.p1 GENE.GHUV01033280.1~~GHUV01033280.1.p1  ORF type:complete len:228 (+),score=42.20 GHUV01033280.1:458-1141(+)
MQLPRGLTVSSRTIRCCLCVAPRYDVMAAGLWGLGGHPKPDGSLKCNHWVTGNNVWVVEAVKPNSLASRDVVVAAEQQPADKWQRSFMGSRWGVDGEYMAAAAVLVAAVPLLRVPPIVPAVMNCAAQSQIGVVTKSKSAQTAAWFLRIYRHVEDCSQCNSVTFTMLPMLMLPAVCAKVLDCYHVQLMFRYYPFMSHFTGSAGQGNNLDDLSINRHSIPASEPCQTTL